ncbi:30S ribosomal protein S1 [Loigolactobacillus coryniformis]|jgi:small subunit ribosomal protein S1|uniref:Ribosomal protein S1 n=2 Tax=Loigolactobacillus coryniformis TaxID=1610 RepID=J3EQL5_9LACO|nr:30S ribosomal protein S1 [Loigolactobacillus coryniformis]RRG07167.1 MAG: 30S ribosomal protein S1 [Lactobacillus sp.]EJN55700.1 Ribosomal protein S1 [Loigolactobacillus coryniformis subsp. coryniformis CECT 5711]MBW4802495.1 30S ribosomal protein S1 [Loigolactobacillus coryniformis subsp. torquens]MBW4805192.1 30S ribosomal protein S1 [Loigolactobacillus coryniformis subsp. torquens]QEA53829.1 30S ribosomal protein S1 [Loigolactobacillus coryniformis]
MSEDNTNQVENKNAMADALNSVHDVKVGDIVKGEILAIDDDKQLIVGIQGTGVEGVVPVKELASQPVADINEVAKVGDVLDLVVISTIGKDKENGSYLLSKRRLEARKVWSEIQDKFNAGENITAPVTEVVKGGLVVDAGVRGFVPASMIQDHFVDDLNAYKGKELELKIIEIEPSENRLILSHRAIVEAEKAEQREHVLATLKAGDTVEGTVARLTSFGAFVDLGGIDGLVHVSEISFDRVEKPSDVLKVGQKITVKVLSVDADRERISLSIKATLPEPWTDIEEKAPAGSVLEGTVKRLTTFGAFVEVFPGVEGLVHISQISHQHIATPNEVLSEGEDVKVKVLEVNPEAHRLALSIKALTSKPAGEESHSAPKAEKNDYQENNSSYQDNDEGGFTLGDLIGDELKHSTDDDQK